jgi:hypothetical protein
MPREPPVTTALLPERSIMGPMSSSSSAARLRATIMRDRERIARDERPTYHATWSPAVDAVDVRIVELPLIHLFVPDRRGVEDGARVLIARTLEVDPSTFDVEVVEGP